MALRGDKGPVGPLAAQAFFEVMNPKLTTETIPESAAKKATGDTTNAKAP